MLAQYPRVRLGIYLLGVASTITAAFVSVYNKDLASAFTITASVLDAVSLGVAVTNMNFKNNGTSTSDGWRG